MAKKNIGIVTTWFERGAAYVSRQYMELLQEKYNVMIYARGGEKYACNDPIWDTPNVHWSKRPIAFYNPTLIDKKDFRKWIKKNNIEVVIFNEQKWWYPVIWCKQWGIKTLAYIDYYTEDTVPFFELYDGLLCNTKRHFEAFSWHKGARYLPWGTDVNLFVPDEKREEDKDKLVFFLSAGMNPDRKGFYPALKAFSELNSPNIKLLVQTQTSLTPFVKDLKDEFYRLVEEKKLEVIEKSIPAPGIYHWADVYVYLSKLDGIGLTVPEALSCGLPVITPNNPPMNEFVNENVGRLVDVTKLYCRADAYYWPQCDISKESVKQAMNYYVNNIDSTYRFKEISRRHALDTLNWEDRKEELLQIIDELGYIDFDNVLLNKITKWQKRKDHIWGKMPFMYFVYESVKKIF
jgi:glycosyltransferase involved in cell wall biosynthesis